MSSDAAGVGRWGQTTAVRTGGSTGVGACTRERLTTGRGVGGADVAAPGPLTGPAAGVGTSGGRAATVGTTSAVSLPRPTSGSAPEPGDFAFVH